MHRMVDEIYQQRNGFCIIGLTGKTGSGCTKAASLLASSKDALEIPSISIDDDSNDNRRKKHIVKKHFDENWNPFTVIAVRDIITTFVLQRSIEDVCQFLRGNPKVKLTLERLTAEYNRLKIKNQEYLEILDRRSYNQEADAQKVHDFIIEDLPAFAKALKDALAGDHYRDYSKYFQIFGDKIRSTGDALGGTKSVEHIYALAKRVNRTIKALKKYNDHAKEKSYFVIDAFRNPFEVAYFKERFAAFYLFAIKAPEDDRHDRLIKIFGLSHAEIENLDKKENPKGSIIDNNAMYVSQNISACIQKADIHINNTGNTQNRNFNELKGRLITYVTLIQHPGIITPQRDEKLMQIAHTAKINSGCISRQVGAVVTNAEGAIVSIGWNDVPKGQTQCLLRNMKHLLKNVDMNSYSCYETRTDSFTSNIRKRLDRLHPSALNGRNLSFCFKDVHNDVSGKENQVHTRALHAEENAFLQIVKHGGQGVNGGTLYSTASPCELCSKKAYQLGIKKIIYLEPYPGIAVSHVIGSGTCAPEMELFSGAIGPAYHKLYEPILPYKDELRAFFPTQEMAAVLEPSTEPEDFVTV